MKKLMFCAVVCAFVVSSCGTKKCVIEGSFSDGDVPSDSTFVVFSDRSSDKADTVKLVDGKFSYECVPSDTTLLRVQLQSTDPSSNVRRVAMVIPQEGTITVDFNTDPVSVTGGALSEAMARFNDDNNALYASFRAIRDSLVKVYPDDEEKLEAELEAVGDSLSKIMNETALATFSANKDNILGVSALGRIIYELSVEEIDSLLTDASDFVKNTRSISRVRAAKVQEKMTSEGCMFLDFEGKTPEGAPTRLSDYVGKGSYTLVDFWASWCGPCKGEIPNIKELYQKYGPKGLSVLGVAVWDKDNSGSRQVMEQLGMEWNQIFVGEDKTATDTYGILGIPCIILFAPDGTIARRDLRGEEMKDAIAELFQ